MAYAWHSIAHGLSLVACARCMLLTLLTATVWAQERLGNDLADRTQPDEIEQVSFIDTSLQFSASGRVTGWDMYAGGRGRLYMQVYRHGPLGVDGRQQYTLVCENKVTLRLYI